MRKLKGWLRLWIVGSVVWVIGASIWQLHDVTWESEKQLDLWLQISTALRAGDAFRAVGCNPDPETISLLTQSLIGDTSFTERKRVTREQMLKIQRECSLSMKELETLGMRFADRIREEREADADRRSRMWQYQKPHVIGMWILAPPLLVLVAGLVVMWVIRGFRTPPKTAPTE